MANINDAVRVCTDFEKVAPMYGFHIGLTGGCLYKGGDRKDLDVLLYQIRQQEPDFLGFLLALDQIGVEVIESFGFCTKIKYLGINIDILYPETKTLSKDGKEYK